jgi:dipicolinate synthase subunit A
MVIGYGRIGRILSKMLRGIGAHVYTVVNRIEYAALSRSYANIPVMARDMDGHLQEMDVIVNTVPKTVLDGANLPHVKKTCLIIDVSSEPYGVDRNACRDLGLKVLYTNSLPGKVAPVSAAGYIKETIYNVIRDAEAVKV